MNTSTMDPYNQPSIIQPWTTWNNNWLTPATGVLLCLERQPDEWIYLCATTEYWMMWNGMVWSALVGPWLCRTTSMLWYLYIVRPGRENFCCWWNNINMKLPTAQLKTKQKPSHHKYCQQLLELQCDAMRWDAFRFSTTTTTTTTTMTTSSLLPIPTTEFCLELFCIYNIQTNEMRNSQKEIGTFNENGVRNFVATKDTSRDFSNSQDNTDRGSMSDQAFAYSASSVESLPSASGSSKYSYYCSISCSSCCCYCF